MIPGTFSKNRFSCGASAGGFQNNRLPVCGAGRAVPILSSHRGNSERGPPAQSLSISKRAHALQNSLLPLTVNLPIDYGSLQSNVACPSNISPRISSASAPFMQAVAVIASS